MLCHIYLVELGCKNKANVPFFIFQDERTDIRICFWYISLKPSKEFFKCHRLFALSACRTDSNWVIWRTEHVSETEGAEIKNWLLNCGFVSMSFFVFIRANVSAVIREGNGLIKAGPSKKREVIVGRRKAVASNINVSTAIRMHNYVAQTFDPWSVQTRLAFPLR